MALSEIRDNTKNTNKTFDLIIPCTGRNICIMMNNSSYIYVFKKN